MYQLKINIKKTLKISLPYCQYNISLNTMFQSPSKASSLSPPIEPSSPNTSIRRDQTNTSTHQSSSVTSPSNVSDTIVQIHAPTSTYSTPGKKRDAKKPEAESKSAREDTKSSGVSRENASISGESRDASKSSGKTRTHLRPGSAQRHSHSSSSEELSPTSSGHESTPLISSSENTREDSIGSGDHSSGNVRIVGSDDTRGEPSGSEITFVNTERREDSQSRVIFSRDTTDRTGVSQSASRKTPSPGKSSHSSDASYEEEKNWSITVENFIATAHTCELINEVFSKKTGLNVSLLDHSFRSSSKQYPGLTVQV